MTLQNLRPIADHVNKLAAYYKAKGTPELTPRFSVPNKKVICPLITVPVCCKLLGTGFVLNKEQEHASGALYDGADHSQVAGIRIRHFRRSSTELFLDQGQRLRLSSARGSNNAIKVLHPLSEEDGPNTLIAFLFRKSCCISWLRYTPSSSVRCRTPLFSQCESVLDRLVAIRPVEFDGRPSVIETKGVLR